MIKNLRRFAFIFVATFFWLGSIHAQISNKFMVSIAAGMSKTGSVKYSNSYREYSTSSIVNIISTSTSRNRNYKFSIGYQPMKTLSIHGSIGLASFGFQYSGDVVANPLNFVSPGGFVSKEEYTMRFMEVGLSASHRIAAKNDITYILQPGIAWYTNPKEDFRQFMGILMNNNNFSATFFAGIEVPIANNSFYINVGINTKVALYNYARRSDIRSKFLPYALGLQIAISYRFGVGGKGKD